MQAPNIIYSEKPGIAAQIFKVAGTKNAALLREKSVEEHRKFQHMLSDVRPLPAEMRARMTGVGGVPCEWITRPGSRDDKVILYLHGGSWAFGDLRTARPVGVLLANMSEYSVLVVDYRRVPEHSYPAALDDCEKVYRRLLETGIRPEHIAVFGDSAGGNLSLCLMPRLHRLGIPLPAAVGCASPVTNLSDSSALIDDIPDVLFARQGGEEINLCDCYLPEGIDRRSPEVSPLFWEHMSELPPVLIHVGEDEPLVIDNTEFAEEAFRQGANVICKIWLELFHDFSIVGRTLKESRQSLREFVEFFEANLG